MGTKTRTTRTLFAAAGLTAAALALLLAAMPPSARAQQQQGGAGNPSATAGNPLVRVGARDRDVRAVLEDLFKQAKIGNYAIAQDVSGTVTMTLTDKAFEDALTLVTRAVSPPLVWSKTDGFYEVKVRTALAVGGRDGGFGAGLPSEPPVLTPDGVRYDMVYPTFSDARDLVRALELLQPSGLTAAFAYVPSNGLLLRFGGPGGFVSGVIGGPGGQNGGPGGPGTGAGGSGAGVGGNVGGVGSSGGLAPGSGAGGAGGSGVGGPR